MTAVDWSRIDVAVRMPVALRVEPETMATVMAVRDRLRELGAASSFGFAKAMPTALARNELAYDVVHATKASHLLMVDDDMVFPAEVVARMVELDVDVVGVAHRVKGFADRLFPWFDLDLRGEQWRQAPVNGAIRVPWVGGGLMLIRRAAFERMLLAYADRRYRYNRAGGDPARDREAVGLFDWQLEDGVLSPREDVAFCVRAARVGVEVWCLLDAEMTHLGPSITGWTGNFVETWQAAQRCHATRTTFVGAPPPLPARIEPNDPCLCGSGQTFSTCCSRAARAPAPPPPEHALPPGPDGA